MKSKKDAIRQKSAFEFGNAPQDLKSTQKIIKVAIEKRTPIIIYGPPGTGKTKVALDIISELKEADQIGHFQSVQFHKKFSYEDFIEGFSPTETGFVKKDGVFKKFCNRPSDTKKANVFLIDEINRAELATTFGEALFALEDRKSREVVTAHFGDTLKIPENLVVIGTMNTADRNIQNIDFAIRRRFRFIPLFPNQIELKTWLNGIGFAFNDFTIDEYCSFFSKINFRIRTHPLLGSHMQLGQALFVPSGDKNPLSLNAVSENFAEVIIPQIEAYFGFGNQRELAMIFNPRIADIYLFNRTIAEEDFSALIKEVINEQQP